MRLTPPSASGQAIQPRPTIQWLSVSTRSRRMVPARTSPVLTKPDRVQQPIKGRADSNGTAPVKSCRLLGRFP